MSPILTDGTYLVTSGGFLTESGGAPAPDAYSVSLLHFDSDFTDEYGLTWAAGGSGSPYPSVTATNTYFGTGSLEFTAFLNVYLACEATANHDFSVGPWTIDWWAKRGDLSGQSRVMFSMNHSVGGKGSFLLNYLVSGNETFYASSNNTTWDIANAQVVAAADTSWHHWEYNWDGSNYRVFRDGTNVLTVASAVPVIGPQAGHVLSIGKVSSDTATFRGSIDEVRVSQGIARHTSAFTPETSPYSS